MGELVTTGGARLILFPRCGRCVTTGGARLVLFPRCGGLVTTGGARLVLFPRCGGCVTTGRARLILFPGCGGLVTTGRARLILFPRSGGLATPREARLGLFPWCEQFGVLAQAFLGGVLWVHLHDQVCLHVQNVGLLFVCRFLGGLLCCYLKGTLAIRLFTVFSGVAGGAECLWAAKFVGWFLGMVALVDTGRLVNDIFISLT